MTGRFAHGHRSSGVPDVDHQHPILVIRDTLPSFCPVVRDISSQIDMAAAFILLLAFATLIPSSFTQCTTEKALPFFRRSVYEFSIDLVKRIAEENENHFVSSALSPWTLISVLSLGADGETYDEIQQVLRLHHHQCFNKKFFEVIQQLSDVKDDTVLRRSSMIVADERVRINEVFRSRIQKTKVSEIKQLSFYDPQTVANDINQYVSQATQGTIQDIVEASDLENVLMVLIDALYFKGAWQSSFLGENTEVSAFYDERRNQIGDVNLMFGEIIANITAVPQIGAKFWSCRTATGGFQCSSFFLTKIPRFKIASDLDNMKEWLIDMGLLSMFDATASFTDLSDEALNVSDFIQKAMIEVTEEGTTASAATAAFVSYRSFEPTTDEFTANKPFLFMIADRHLELAVFTGAYSKPTVY
ncbi:serpin (serine protease inhibitor) domain-containing protein [Phthorimaea operculella]|nr:serpin (serine protease inhibitor) domain-containing protein [Phthorimaea operculella]